MKVYIAGKITGDPDYWGKFCLAEQELIAQGHIVLNPAELPPGMEPSDYMPICFAMIEREERVMFLPDWKDSKGARLEHEYCKYIQKRIQYI